MTRYGGIWVDDDDNIATIVVNPDGTPVGGVVVEGGVTVDQGTAITGQSLEPGGAGPLGWLSSLRVRLAAIEAAILALDTGGTSDATAAHQVTQTTHLNAIETAVETLQTAAATAAAQTTQTTHLNAIETAVEALQTAAATAAHQVTQNTALAAIRTAVELLDDAIANGAMQTDVLSLPTLPVGDNNIGNVDVASMPASLIGQKARASAFGVTLSPEDLAELIDAFEAGGGGGGAGDASAAHQVTQTTHLTAIEVATEAIQAAAASNDPAPVIEHPADTATLSSVASSTSSQVALPANPNRLHVTAINTDANQCRLKYGSTASASSFSYLIGPGDGTWEMPYRYTGPIDVIWDGNGSGSLHLTELTNAS